MLKEKYKIKNVNTIQGKYSILVILWYMYSTVTSVENRNMYILAVNFKNLIASEAIKF